MHKIKNPVEKIGKRQRTAIFIGFVSRNVLFDCIPDCFLSEYLDFREKYIEKRYISIDKQKFVCYTEYNKTQKECSL